MPTDTDTPRQWLTPAEAMERIHVSRSTLNRLIASGSLTVYRTHPGARSALLDAAELDALVQSTAGDNYVMAPHKREAAR